MDMNRSHDINTTVDNSVNNTLDKSPAKNSNFNDLDLHLLEKLEKLKILEKKQPTHRKNYINWLVKPAPFVFLYCFTVSFLGILPGKFIPFFNDSTVQTSPSANKLVEPGVNGISSINNVNEATVTPTILFIPDLFIPYAFNYKTSEYIPASQKAFTEYLKQPQSPIEFNVNEPSSLDFKLDSTDIINSINHLKHLITQEDLSIIPFKSGEVFIESEILETIQSDSYYMISVLKTFTQGKKVVKVLEKKVFPLQSLEKGHVHYIKNIIVISTETNK